MRKIKRPSAEEYKRLTGQGIGALKNQNSGTVNNTNSPRTVTGVRG